MLVFKHYKIFLLRILFFIEQHRKDQLPHEHSIESNFLTKTFETPYPPPRTKLTSTPEEELPEKSENLLGRIVEILSRMEEQSQHHQHKEIIRSEWMLVAMVLDRVMLILFSMLTLAVSVAILCFRPGSDDVSNITIWQHSTVECWGLNGVCTSGMIVYESVFRRAIDF